MLTVTENTTQQINAALFEQDQNVKNKLSTVSGVVSAVYGACEWIFNKLKESLARVATTGSYNDLTDKPTIVDTVAQNVPNAVSSNAVYGALTNCRTPNYSNVVKASFSAGETWNATEDCFLIGYLSYTTSQGSHDTSVTVNNELLASCYSSSGTLYTPISLPIRKGNTVRLESYGSYLFKAYGF